jgi:hypothetical protein
MANIECRLELLEAKEAIRTCLGRYFDLCDVPGPLRHKSELAALFTPEAVWEGLGEAYAGKFGRITGRHQIAEHVIGYLPPSDHFRRNAHLVGSEQLHSDGHTGSGQWLMQQLSEYADGSGDLLCARLRIDFVIARNDGEVSALMSHFRTERLYSAGVSPKV